MSDEKLRELERRFRETGSAEDEVAWLRERARSGEDLVEEAYSLLEEQVPEDFRCILQHLTQPVSSWREVLWWSSALLPENERIEQGLQLEAMKRSCLALARAAATELENRGSDFAPGAHEAVATFKACAMGKEQTAAQLEADCESLRKAAAALGPIASFPRRKDLACLDTITTAARSASAPAPPDSITYTAVYCARRFLRPNDLRNLLLRALKEAALVHCFNLLPLK